MDGSGHVSVHRTVFSLDCQSAAPWSRRGSRSRGRGCPSRRRIGGLLGTTGLGALRQLGSKWSVRSRRTFKLLLLRVLVARRSSTACRCAAETVDECPGFLDTMQRCCPACVRVSTKQVGAGYCWVRGSRTPPGLAGGSDEEAETIMSAGAAHWQQMRSPMSTRLRWASSPWSPSAPPTCDVGRVFVPTLCGQAVPVVSPGRKSWVTRAARGRPWSRIHQAVERELGVGAGRVIEVHCAARVSLALVPTALLFGMGRASRCRARCNATKGIARLVTQVVPPFAHPPRRPRRRRTNVPRLWTGSPIGVPLHRPCVGGRRCLSSSKPSFTVAS
jgi:hypothetical protein